MEWESANPPHADPRGQHTEVGTNPPLSQPLYGDHEMSNWHSKYRNRAEFLSWFDTEQEYVDAMFALIVMYNYGVWIDSRAMLATR